MGIIINIYIYGILFIFKMLLFIMFRCRLIYPILVTIIYEQLLLSEKIVESDLSLMLFKVILVCAWLLTVYSILKRVKKFLKNLKMKEESRLK